MQSGMPQDVPDCSVRNSSEWSKKISGAILQSAESIIFREISFKHSDQLQNLAADLFPPGVVFFPVQKRYMFQKGKNNGLDKAEGIFGDNARGIYRMTSRERSSLCSSSSSQRNW